MKIESPFIWLTYPLKASPKPWKHYKVEGIMLNAYDILQNSGAVLEKLEKYGVHKFISFRGPILMDSGGFQILKKNIKIDPTKILNLYINTKPNFGVILDHPIPPLLNNKSKRLLQIKNLKLIKMAIEAHKDSNPVLIPVVHGYDLKSVEWYLNELEKIYDFEYVGIGSLVPSVFNSKGAVSIYEVVKMIRFMRKRFPDKWIHVFGVGSAITMHLMFYLGANSVDSSSWRVKAAYGAIQLPGIGDRYITDRKRWRDYKGLSDEELSLLESCKCPICRKYSIEGLKERFIFRALHNAWVYQKEVRIARKFIKNKKYSEYVENVIKNSRKYSKLFEFCKELIEKN